MTDAPSSPSCESAAPVTPSSSAAPPSWLKAALLGSFAVFVGSVSCLLIGLECLGYRWTLAVCAAAGISVMLVLIFSQVWADSSLSNANIDGLTGCEYCGGATARVVCKDCKLVQWKRLSGVGNVLFWSAFMVSYRWQINAAVFSFALVSAISLGGRANEIANRNGEKGIEQERATREAKLTTTLRVAEAGAAFRGALLMIEATCPNPRSAECASHFSAFRDSYYRYSLQAPAVIYEFIKLCAELAARPRYPSADTVGQSRKLMCGLVARMKTESTRQNPKVSNGENKNESLIDELNKNFRRYINLVATCAVADAGCTRKRRELALVLYENGRIAQCAVAEVAYEAMFYGIPKPFTTYTRCEDPHWLTQAPALHEGDLDWLGWPALRDVPATAARALPLESVSPVGSGGVEPSALPAP